MDQLSLNTLENVIVLRQMGGLIEFTKTGSYPDYLVFKSPVLKKTWRQKVKSEKQYGTIKSNGHTLFHYQLTENRFRMQYVCPDGSISKWIKKDVILMLLD